MSLFGLTEPAYLQLGSSPRLNLYIKIGNDWKREEDYAVVGDEEELHFGLGPNENTIFAEAIIQYIPYYRSFEILAKFDVDDKKEQEIIKKGLTEIEYVMVHPRYYGKGFGLEILKRVKPYVRGYAHANMYSQRIFEHLYKVFGLPYAIFPVDSSAKRYDAIHPKLPEEVRAYLDLNPILGYDMYQSGPRLMNERNCYALWK